MEKRLGKEESFIVKTDSIIAFEDSVSFETFSFNKIKSFITFNSFAKVNGPGLLLFAATNSEAKVKPAFSFVNNLLIIVIIIMLFFVMHKLESIAIHGINSIKD